MTLFSGKASALPKKALITGVRGQDGSYLAERLMLEGWEVHGLVRPGTSSDFDTIVHGVHFHTGDLMDGPGLAGLVAEVKPDTLFNLGGVSSVATSWREPYQTSMATGSAAIALLDACWQVQETLGYPVRYLQASSAEIFGNSIELPQTEETPILPASPYGAAKAFAHHATGVFRSRGLFASTAILYNHESLRRPSAFVTRKITMGVAAIALGLRDRLVLGNLDAVRDFGWAPDYVEALAAIAAADAPDDFIVATGISHSVKEFAEAAFTAAGITDGLTLVDTDPRFARPSDAPQMRGNPSKIANVLGWRATTNFDSVAAQMVAHDINFLRQHGPSVLPEA